MRTFAALAVLVLGAGLAAADPKPEAKPESTVTQSKQCKKVVVGRGLDRKVVCEITQEIEVKETVKPAVLIVNKGGREVVGRPKSGDRLAGLSRRRR